ncbi:TMV resistance protein N-like [Neltuma alba]|uniref:TMV resistance protein N-like n=1 Tax=Neltuma alba TaxID=207710 RepID=UPI0010A515FE|nr:TMV resistance protein N-like [Prosopis alba]
MERRRGDDVGIKNGNINLGSGNEIEVGDDNLMCPQAEDSDDAELDDDCFHQFLDVDVENVGQGSRGSNHLAEFESVHSEAVTTSELPNENTLAMLSDLEDDELYEEYACDDEDNKAITRYEKYNSAQMCKEFEFKLGMEFNSVQQFREVLKEYCLLHGYDVKFLKNDKERCRVRCKKKCGWLILVSKVGGSMTFRVKTLGPKHTCGVTFNSRLATSKWVSNKIVDHMRMNKNLKPGDVVSIVKQNYMVQPSINKAFWARKIAKKTIEGDHKEEYNKLVNFCNEVKKRNPQSTFALVTDTTYYVDRPRVFKRLGEDTRKGFTDHLHAALKQKGIITFLDDGLNRGEVISDQLLQAIDESLISLVVLSQSYASSSWCLDELERILQSKKTLGREVIPIFYDIHPSDVRHQRGTFGCALQNHGERFARKKLRRWRDALKEVANISGYDSTDRHEAKLIEEIIAEVWAKLQPKLLCCYSYDLVGIESRVEEVNSLLKLGFCDVRLIGIWGMPGIGKTTLARIVYERIFHQFDLSCFLADVKESSEAKGLVSLQRKLFYKLKIKGMEVDDTYDGKNIIRNMLCNKKVLVVLDDVSEINQLENLCIKQAWLGPGSRVIVTTKNMHVLVEHGEFEIYEAELLNDDESLQLFCKKAFKRDEPIEGYWKLCKDIIHHAQGLPLTLEVLGSYFCGRSELEWKEGLEKIKKSPPSNILKRLRINYDALSDTEKKIFLDVACCFKGMIKDHVVQIFEICGDLFPTLGIRELVEKCLLKEYYSNDGACHLGMHDILQNLGRSIVIEESLNDASRRSRLWSLEDIDYVMSKNNGTNMVELIHHQSHMPYEANWDPKAFSMMHSLTILIILCDVYLPRGLEFLPRSLKFLEWKGYPLRSLPYGAQLDELVLLRMHHSKIMQLWGCTQISKKLKFIDLSYSEDFIRTPDLRMLPNLEHLILEGCVKLTGVHPSLGQHKKLVLLDLKDCKNLKALPSRMGMDSLEKLILSGCLKVKKLPEFGENMTSLLVLDVENCKNLVCLPSSTCYLKSLKVLNILGCSKFSSLPQNIDENKCLEELDLSGTAIREIPSSIVGLQDLKLLYLKGCKSLSSRSNSLVSSLFSSIKEVLGFYNGSSTISSSLSYISSVATLKELHLDDCNLKVGSIPDELGCLTSLETLSLRRNDFGNASTNNCVLPPSFSRLSSLKYLYMCCCNLNDGSIPKDLNSLLSLERLGLLGNNFTHIPADCISNLLHLHTLHLSHCPRLKCLPNLPPNLRRIDTVACQSMQSLSFPELLLKCIAFANASVVDTNNIRCSIWWILGSQIPSWFHNQDFQVLDKIDGFQDNHVVQTFEEENSYQSFHDTENGDFVQADSIVSMEVNIADFHGSSGSWGTSLCVVLQDMGLDDAFDLYLKMTCKASGDEFFKKEIGWPVSFEGHSHQILIMFLPSINFADDCNKVEVVFYTTRIMRTDSEAELDVKADYGDHGKRTISKCGWRVTRKEDVEEWLRTIQQYRSSTSENNEILSQQFVHGRKRYREGEDLQEEVTINDVETEINSTPRRKLKLFP